MTARDDEAEDLAAGPDLEQQLLGPVNPADDGFVGTDRDEHDLIRGAVGEGREGGSGSPAASTG